MDTSTLSVQQNC